MLSYSPQCRNLLASIGGATCCLWPTGLLLLLAMLLPAGVQAQQAESTLRNDTLSIRFAVNEIRIDMDYADNRRNWNEFVRRFREHGSRANMEVLRLDIYAGASPEGTAQYNRWLGEHRGRAIRRMVRDSLGLSMSSIIVHNEEARWNEFYDAVERSNELWRDEVLAILDQPRSEREDVIDHREARLRSLYRGRLWPKLEKYLAPLRSGASAVLTWRAGSPPATGGGRRDTVIVRDTVVIVHNIPFPVSGNTVAVPPAASHKKARRDSLRQLLRAYPAWAVKTNLLLWGIVAPNLQVEAPLGRNNRWSLEAEVIAPWFIWADNARAQQCLNVGAELRYWLGNRKRRPFLHGWHIGLAVAAGYYDIEWKAHEGYQGEHLNAYLNLGYQHRMGRHWALDAGIGLGAMLTKYRHYYGSSVYPDTHLTERDDLLIWHDTGHYRWLGPCHAHLSLVYMFNAWPFHFKSKKINP